jgi:GT2 family glycosyltransferase
MLLCVPTYKRFKECIDLIRSAHISTVRPTKIIVTDNSQGQFLHYIRSNRIDVGDIPLLIDVAPSNLGCARAWNRMITNAYQMNPEEHVLISNDDIQLEENTIALFEGAIKEHPEEIIYCTGGMKAPNAFSLFATRWDKLYDSVGLFDEMFLYPYLEDSDMARRLLLAGKELYRVPEATAQHIGSATIAAYDEQEMLQHHVRFNRNVEYMNMKWGIIDHNKWMTDGFTEAFDGDEGYRDVVYSTIKNLYGE